MLLSLFLATFLQTGSAIQLETVAERQVFQRDERHGADVRVEGSCADGTGALGVRVVHGGKMLAWKPLALHDLDGPRQRFDGVVRVPQGGWFTLELAESETSEALFQRARVGVGEVFVVAGQSNSTNYGEERTPALDDRVSAFDGLAWTLAQDPMPGVQDRSAGGSPWPRFGQLVVQALDLPVAIASTGFGGTSIRAWQKDHQYVTRDERKFVLLTGLADRLSQVGGARAVLWHQGESDALGSMATADYVRLFEAMRTALAKDLDRPLPPFVVAHASYAPDLAAEKMERIRVAQSELWRSGAALQGPETDDLLGDMRHSKDHIHFSKKGLEAHAARWFACVYAQLLVEPRLAPVR